MIDPHVKRQTACHAAFAGNQAREKSRMNVVLSKRAVAKSKSGRPPTTNKHAQGPRGGAVDRSKPNIRQLEAAASRDDILRVAIEEFAEHGLSGARVDVIAERMQTSKRMIYYYFGSKDGLYIEVLERLYAGIRDSERSIKTDHLPPAEALRIYVESTYDYHMANPRVGRMIGIENINKARFVKQSKIIQSANSVIIEMLSKLIRRGIAAKEFRSSLAAIDLFYLISALCVYRVSNRDTFNAIFDLDFAAPAVARRHKRLVTDTIMSYVSSADA
jgi:AcrR family transcriptional regulator